MKNSGKWDWKILPAIASTVLFATAASAEVKEGSTNDENIEVKVEEANLPPPKISLYPVDRDWYNALYGAKQELKNKTGVEIALESTTIYQISSGVRPANQAVETTTALFGRWTFWQHENKIDAAGFGFAAENRVNYAGPNFTEMTRDLGTLWSPNDSSSDDYTKFTQVWFSQRLFEGKATYIVGLIDPGAYLNGNRFAGSGNTQFFSQPFATNPARTFADNGIGFVGRLSPVPWLQLQAEISNGDAVSVHSPFTSFNGNWFKAGEVVFIPQVPTLGEGRYRFLLYQQDNDAATSCGWALSFDQNIGPDWGTFFRFGHNDGNISAIEHLAAAGISWLKPFGRSNDQCGVGVSWTRPTNDALRDEYSAEIYYRLQLTDFLDVSPSAQMIVHPSASNDDVIGVFGFRMHLLF